MIQTGLWATSFLSQEREKHLGTTAFPSTWNCGHRSIIPSIAGHYGFLFSVVSTFPFSTAVYCFKPLYTNSHQIYSRAGNNSYIRTPTFYGPICTNRLSQGYLCISRATTVQTSYSHLRLSNTLISPSYPSGYSQVI